jgi:hypothetical protein
MGCVVLALAGWGAVVAVHSLVHAIWRSPPSISAQLVAIEHAEAKKGYAPTYSEAVDLQGKRRLKTIELEASHASLASQPHAVCDLIDEALGSVA